MRDFLLRILYIMARWGRDMVWAIRRPHLRGVRTVVIDATGAVLLVRHRAGPDAWVIPGGGVDGAEAGATAARRELYEEAGIVIPDDALHHHGEFTGAHAVHPCTVNVYVARLDFHCTPQPKWYSIEIATARFVPVAQLGNLDDYIEPGCLRRIREVVDQRPAVAIW